MSIEPRSRRRLATIRRTGQPAPPPHPSAGLRADKPRRYQVSKAHAMHSEFSLTNPTAPPLPPDLSAKLANLPDTADRLEAACLHGYVWACIGALVPQSDIEAAVCVPSGCLGVWLASRPDLAGAHAMAVLSAADELSRRARGILAEVADMPAKAQRGRALMNIAADLRCQAEAKRTLAANILRRTAALTNAAAEARRAAKAARKQARHQSLTNNGATWPAQV